MSCIVVLCFLLLFLNSPSYVEAKSVKDFTRKFEDGERRVLIFDSFFPARDIWSLFELVTSGKVTGKVSSWVYTYSDYYQQIRTLNTSRNSPWIAPVSPEFFTETSVWNITRQLLEKISGGKEYFPYDICFSMQRRLDFVMTTETEQSTDENDLMLRIFLNQDFRKNDYGEAIFYKQNGEILAAVHPRMGRLVVWNASVPFTSKPPAMSYVQAQYDIIVKLSTSKEKTERNIQETKKIIEKSEMQDSLEFALSNEDEIPLFNLKEYETKRFHDSKGREIAVFDNVLNKADLDALRLYLLHYNSVFRYQAFDGHDEEHDNVSWIAVLEVKEFVKSRLWKLVKQVATYLSGLTEWYPYDVSMNIIRSSHYPRVHEDCEVGEDEYTFLLYLTPDWEANNYGETAFFEEVFQSNGRPFPPGKQKYEWVASVRPRYGRIVIFHGIIPHSARPPSPSFTGARYTFACKISRTYRLAITKSLRETLEYLDYESVEDPEAYKLQDELSEGVYDNPNRPTEFIERDLEKYREKRNELLEISHKSVVNRVAGSKE